MEFIQTPKIDQNNNDSSNNNNWGQKCLILVFWGQKFQKLLSYLKLAPSNLSNFKIS